MNQDTAVSGWQHFYLHLYASAVSLPFPRTAESDICWTLKLGAQAVACGGHAQRCNKSWSSAGGGRGSLQCPGSLSCWSWKHGLLS